MSDSSLDANKATIRRLVDAHNRRDASEAAACFAPASTNHGRIEGPEGMERVYRDLYVTFPDYHWEIIALFGEGNRIALHVRQTGTHLGTPELPVLGGLLHDVSPTGKFVAVYNIHLYEMENALVVRHSAIRDDLGMMQQMGLPESRHALGDLSRPRRG